MKLSTVLSNEHFNSLAAIIRVPFRSEKWRNKHAEVPFWTLESGFSDLVNFTPGEKPPNKAQVIERFTNLIVELTKADSRLACTEEDYKWFIEVLDVNEWWKLSLLCAWYSAPDTMMTPAEVAEATETAESTWRNKAAAGEIPGAFKKGKQWLLPRSVLRGKGVL